MAGIGDSLTDVLKNFPNLKVSPSDLHKPTTECVVSIYLELLSLLGIDCEKLKKPLKMESQYYTYYDADLKFIVKLYSVLDLVFQESGFRGFDLTDLLEPSRETLAAAVAVLYNLLLYKNSKADVVNQIVGEASERMEKYRRMLTHREKLKEEINRESRNKAELSMKSDQLKREMGEIENRIFVLHEAKGNVSESLVESAKVLAEHNDKINKLEKEANKLFQITEELKKQIVKSPDQLVQNLENLKATEQKLKEEQNNISESLQNAKLHFDKLTDCVHSAKAAMEQMQDIHKLLDEIRNLERTLERLEMEKTKLEQDIYEIKEDSEWIKKTEMECLQQLNLLNEELAHKKEEARCKLRDFEEKATENENRMSETISSLKEERKVNEDDLSKLKKEKQKSETKFLEAQMEAEEMVKKVKDLLHVFCHTHQQLLEYEETANDALQPAEK